MEYEHPGEAAVLAATALETLYWLEEVGSGTFTVWRGNTEEVRSMASVFDRSIATRLVDTLRAAASPNPLAWMDHHTTRELATVHAQAMAEVERLEATVANLRATACRAFELIVTHGEEGLRPDERPSR